MKDRKKWIYFAVGLALGMGAGIPSGIAASGCPEIEITTEVLDAYCTGRVPHTCPTPCKECPSPCADPCPEIPEETNCDGEWELKVVPFGEVGEFTYHDNATGWGEWEEVRTGEGIDWSLVTAPDFDQAVLSFRWRWKYSKRIQPVLATSWTRGSSGSKSLCDKSWGYGNCVTTSTLATSDEWEILLGVGGNFP